MRAEAPVGAEHLSQGRAGPVADLCLLKSRFTRYLSGIGSLLCLFALSPRAYASLPTFVHQTWAHTRFRLTCIRFADNC